MWRATRRRPARLGGFAVVLCSLAAASLACSGSPPNIVLIIGDDHGYPHSGFSGSKVAKTPHLDALAASGVSFYNAFVTASSCRASHRSLLSGFHPVQWNAAETAFGRAGREDFLQTLPTLPRLLAARGYATFQGGKLWEGKRPADAGFSHGTGTTGWKKRGRGKEVETPELGRDTMQPLWDFLDAHQGVPFFVWFAPKLPHTPFDAPKRFHAHYRQLGLTPRTRAYYANVTRLDERVGELLEKLSALELREKTAVFYISDNGWTLDPPGESVPTRGKHSIAESGFHTPLLASWPGRFPAGEVRDDIVSTVDLYPTLLALAGIEPEAELPGVDLLPTLLRGKPSPRREAVGGVEVLYPTIRSEYFLRTAEWRFVWDRLRDRRALYAIRNDPEERRDVAAAHTEVATELGDRLEARVDGLLLPPLVP